MTMNMKYMMKTMIMKIMSIAMTMIMSAKLIVMGFCTNDDDDDDDDENDGVSNAYDVDLMTAILIILNVSVMMMITMMAMFDDDDDDDGDDDDDDRPVFGSCFCVCRHIWNITAHLFPSHISTIPK